MLADDKVIISDWPANVGSTQDVICDNAATYMASQGYTVFRTPARSISGVHYTYANMLVCNNLIVVPSYTNSQMTQYNAWALATVQAAAPGKTVVAVSGQAMVSSAGVFHCIAMHVPVHKGGLNPTAYLKNLRGGDVLTHGNSVQINWISDDDKFAVQSIDLQLSTDGDATWPTAIATGIAPSGQFVWTVPDVNTTQARVRVVAHDNESLTGSDESPADFTINGTLPCPADLDGNGIIDLSDLSIQLSHYGQSGATPAQGDLNGDTIIDLTDLSILISVYGTNCP
ncbi:MAG: agmatine deiminase family protein [Deltaproteobacteria bacterium]|nr:agmatine deiminase family protein [Deltaproteobacteria bacterium]